MGVKLGFRWFHLGSPAIRPRTRRSQAGLDSSKQSIGARWRRKQSFGRQTAMSGRLPPLKSLSFQAKRSPEIPVRNCVIALFGATV